MKSAALFLVQTLLGKPPKLSSYPVRWGGGEDEVLPKPCPLNLSDSIYARFKLHNYIPKNSSVRISRKHVNQAQQRRQRRYLKIYIVRQSDEGLTLETSAQKLSTAANLH